MRGIKPKRLATQDAWVCPALRRAGALLAVSPTAGSASAITRHGCGVWAPRRTRSSPGGRRHALSEIGHAGPQGGFQVFAPQLQ